MEEEETAKKGPNFILKLLVVVLFVAVVGVIINIAPNYMDNKIKDRVNLIINNDNVTLSLKNDIYINNGIVYMSTKDIANFFDGEIFYDNKYDQILTGPDKVFACLPINKHEITKNGSNLKISGAATKKEDQFYLPFSELADVYDVEVNYIKNNNVVVIESLSKEKITASTIENCDIKYLPTVISKTLEKVEKGKDVVVIPSDKNLDGWTKVRTENGNIGYAKELGEKHTVREAAKNENQFDGKISLVWDYYETVAPTRTEKIEGINVVSPTIARLRESGQGDLVVNIGTSGQAYINWAHNNGYKVWALISNGSHIDTTSEILNDYKLREKLINNIADIASYYNLDGINIDFEYMYKSDKDMFSRFIIELAPRLRANGKVLSVDVTAPDGSENWSGCYDRHTLGKAADYLVFMAYDQYGASDNVAGTTAGLDWVEVSVKKFVGTQEEVNPEKIILGMPLYTRLWWNKENGEETSVAVPINKISENIPAGVEKKWDDSLKQNYVEFQKNGRTYKMWLEDEASIRERFKLMHEYNLAGAAYWEKGYEENGYWSLVSELIKTIK